MTCAATPLDDVRDISKLAYGFMASKALFVALEIDVFGSLAAGQKTLAELASDTGIVASRLHTLLTACVSVGLLTKSGDRYANAPASQEYLVRTAPRYFGDYYRFQIDRPNLPSLWAARRRAARQATAIRRGHARQRGGRLFQPRAALGLDGAGRNNEPACGPQGPAKTPGRRGRQWRRSALRSAGAIPTLTCTIMDFPAVEQVAQRFIGEAKLEDRIHFLTGNALETEWPADQDVVLISYLLSAVGATAIPSLLRHAFKALAPGGLLIVHDFMVEDEGTGPTAAALWLLTSLLIDPDAELLAPGLLSEHIAKAGFAGIRDQEVIPTITR